MSPPLPCKRHSGRVSVDSIIISHCWRGYDGWWMSDTTSICVSTKASTSPFPGVHINGIEAFWSFTKRRLAKFNGVKKNFPLHLKESEWRWNKPSDKRC